MATASRSKTDVEIARAAVSSMLALEPVFKVWINVLDDILVHNQNPGCGGDRSISGEQYEGLRDILDAIRNLRYQYSIFSRAKAPPTLAEEDAQRGITTMLKAAPSAVKIVDTSYEGCRVYALLSDDTGLVSPPLDNEQCARIHAEQVRDLGLTPEFLVLSLRWTEAI